MRRGDEAAVLPPGQRRAQIFAARAVGFQVGAGDRRFEPMPGGFATQGADQRFQEQFAADHRRHRIARQAQHDGGANLAMDQRLARLHVDLPEFQRHALRRQGAAHEIAIAHGGPADGDENIYAQVQRAAYGGFDGFGLVWGDPEVDRHAAAGRDQAEHGVGVGGDDLVRAAFFAGRNQFVAGGQHGDDRPPRDGKGWMVGGCGEGDVGRGQSPPRLQNGFALAEIHAGDAHVLALETAVCAETRSPSRVASSWISTLSDPCGSDAPRENSDRLAWAADAVKPGAGGGFADHLQRLARILGAQGVAVHG